MILLSADSKVLALFNPCYGNAMTSGIQRQPNRMSNPNQFKQNDLLVVVYGIYDPSTFGLDSLFFSLRFVCLLYFVCVCVCMCKIGCCNNKEEARTTHHVKSAC